MKIGFDAKRAYHNRTGLGNYSRYLMDILSRYYPDNEYSLYNPSSAKVEFDTGKEKLPDSFWGKKLPSLWRSCGIVSQLQREGIELYHGLSGELPYGIGKTDIKTVVTIHDLIFLRYPKLYNPIDRKIYTAKFRYACQKADLIIAISKQTQKDIIEFLSISEEKIRVVYQGCNPIFRQKKSKENLQTIRERFSLPEKFILSVGTIEERKNLLNVVKAVQLLGTEIPVVVVGKGKAYAEKVKGYVSARNMKKQIIFLDGVYSSDLVALYQLADIFIYPSVFEGFGIPILEAISSHTPVITTGSGVFPEVGGEAALYIDPQSPEGIATAIDMLWNNKENIADELKNNCQKQADFFSDTNNARNTMNVYRELC